MSIVSSVLGFSLKSPLFENQGEIPCEYACCGKGITPELFWSDPPEETVSFALKLTDQTIGKIHWLIYDIPGKTRQLPGDLGRDALLSNGTLQGINDFGEIGYTPLCPPIAEKHFYLFDLFALNATLGPVVKKNGSEWDKQVEKHSLAHAQLSGFLQISAQPTPPNPSNRDPGKKQNPDALPNPTYPPN